MISMHLVSGRQSLVPCLRPSFLRSLVFLSFKKKSRTKKKGIPCCESVVAAAAVVVVVVVVVAGVVFVVEPAKVEGAAGDDAGSSLLQRQRPRGLRQKERRRGVAWRQKDGAKARVRATMRRLSCATNVKKERRGGRGRRGGGRDKFRQRVCRCWC